MRIKPIELPHLAVGAPAEITVPGLAQIGVGECLEAARGVEPGGHLIGQTFVLHEAVVAGGANGLLVQAHRHRASRPSIRATSAPTSAARLTKFSGQWSAQLSSFSWCSVSRRAMKFAVLKRGGFMDRRVAKRTIEVILNDIQTKHNRPEHRLRPGGRVQGVHVFAREETCLQLADVVRTIR